MVTEVKAVMEVEVGGMGEVAKVEVKVETETEEVATEVGEVKG